MRISIVFAVSALGLTVAPAVAHDLSEYRIAHPADRFVTPMGGPSESYFRWIKPTDAIGRAYELFEQNEPGKALTLLQSAATEGDVIAMRVLGQLYAHGRMPYARRSAVQTDAIKSLNWFTAAAEASDAPSMYLLGHLYQSNNVFAANFEKSSYWLQREAENEDYKVKRAVGRASFSR